MLLETVSDLNDVCYQSTALTNKSIFDINLFFDRLFFVVKLS